MRHTLACLAVLLFAMPAFAQQAQPDAKKPNIVFIIADDLGITDLGCYGRKDHRTPNLDKLAARGIRFTTAYAAQSVCSPTRAAIMSGLTPARVKITTFLPGRGNGPSQLLRHPEIDQRIADNFVLLPQRLKAAGYRTACIGKWHLGGKGSLPTERGFDLYHPGQATTKPSETEGGKGEYDLTAAAEKFLDDVKGGPFFLYVSHNNPHIALIAKKELVEKNKDAFNPTYAAMVETLDDCVGRLIAKLEALGIADNTLIVFTSDNGGLHVLEGGQTPTYNFPYRAGKGFLYEGGVRIPLIVAWPGKTKPDTTGSGSTGSGSTGSGSTGSGSTGSGSTGSGSTDKTPVISTDWTPTFLDVAGVKTKDAFDGVSLFELITTGKSPPPRPLFWHQPHYTNQGSRPMGAVREGPWKLIEHYENGRCELFNLDADIGETTDVAAKEPGRVADLRGKLEKWRRDVGAQGNLPNSDFNGTLAKRIYRDEDVSRLAAAEKASEVNARLAPWRAAINAALDAKKSSGGAGCVILLAKDAKVHGDKLRFEPQPQKDTLGFWVNKDDWAEWKFEVPHKGTFDIEVLQACGKGSGGAEIEFAVGGQTKMMTVEETGHFQRFIPRTIGAVTLDAGETTLSVRAKTKPGPAVMDLRRITLRESAK